MPHFMIILIPHIKLLNLSWVMKLSILRNMEPLMMGAGDGGAGAGEGSEFLSMKTCLLKYIENFTTKK